VVPSGIKHLKIVVDVLAVIDSVHAGIHVVITLIKCVADTGCQRGLRVLGPGSHVMARGEPQLNQPSVIESDCTEDACIRKRVDGI